MRIGYFSAAWQDIKNSQGWVGKLLLLSLLLFVPVFGWIAVAGYLLGWARDMAWGVHGPLPARIFGNEDGRLYSRGFFAWLIRIVFGIVPLVILMFGNVALGVGMVGVFPFRHGAFGHSAGVFSGLSLLVMFAAAIVLAVLALAFTWVGWMRMSVYGRLSAGFQFGRIWAMIRHDARGLARIVGMAVLAYVIASLLVGVLLLFAMLGMALFVALLAGLGAGFDAPGMAVWAVVAIVLCALAFSYVGLVVTVFCEMLVMRALGYWTRGFDVPHWRGQDDPMPFEIARAQGRTF